MHYNVSMLREAAKEALDAEYQFRAYQRETGHIFDTACDEYSSPVMDWNETMKLLQQKRELKQQVLELMCILVDADEKTVIAVEKSINRRIRQPWKWTTCPDIRREQEQSYIRNAKWNHVDVMDGNLPF